MNDYDTDWTKTDLGSELKARSCIVKDHPGYFHCWEYYSEPIAPGLAIGSHPGGVFSRVYAIVEFSFGVKRVDIHDLTFTDEDHASLCALEKLYMDRKQL